MCSGSSAGWEFQTGWHSCSTQCTMARRRRRHGWQARRKELFAHLTMSRMFDAATIFSPATGCCEMTIDAGDGSAAETFVGAPGCEVAFTAGVVEVAMADSPAGALVVGFAIAGGATVTLARVNPASFMESMTDPNG